ncbi:hypothetical protein SELMODRAFT_419253 [Selaginella moellendorffii]|uniref:glucose-6-phosphate dehydrogenase (NADP(+)) n=1 Tax=Selaginella moellendorffii TaxID=88036 RepID=D8S8B8_SELML|nr:hypothetical protein SELMODRAFT_419253 [Selaginella moellendorffii]
MGEALLDRSHFVWLMKEQHLSRMVFCSSDSYFRKWLMLLTFWKAPNHNERNLERRAFFATNGVAATTGASHSTVSITLVGESGDLAKKKIFPVLFALFYEGHLPQEQDDRRVAIEISGNLTCRTDRSENCGDKMEEFLKRCFYHPGQYDWLENFAQLHEKLKGHEQGRIAHRLFYLSVPPNVFVAAANIDHYLGKELVENLSVLRFSNLVFEPLWSRKYIRNVQIVFAEDFGTEGRGGYFDRYGIIRDIMQNHLLQIVALFAMEPPVSLDAEDVRNEKVKVVRSMRPLSIEDTAVGQYKGYSKDGVRFPGYTDDSTVPKNRITPTFAAAALFIDNARWDGMPFLMKAGKALQTRRTEIRVQFRHVPGNLFKWNLGILFKRNSPDEAIYLKINNKVPGLGMRLDRSTLDLLYADRYSKEIPDAYERLLLDAIAGERRLFVRSNELDAAWKIFTPLLKDLERKKTAPELYPYGSRGPVGAHYLATKHNVKCRKALILKYSNLEIQRGCNISQRKGCFFEREANDTDADEIEEHGLGLWFLHKRLVTVVEVKKLFQDLLTKVILQRRRHCSMRDIFLK